MFCQTVNKNIISAAIYLNMHVFERATQGMNKELTVFMNVFWLQ